MELPCKCLLRHGSTLFAEVFESLQGAQKAIVHVYNSTSPLQRRVTFGMSKEQIKQIAVEGVLLVKKLLPELPDTEVQLEYSPESFSDTEVEYSLEVCQAVMDAWGPTNQNPIILNLPATVELFTPNVHADQIEWFCKNLHERDKAIISLHTHNDRGTGTAATELGLLAVLTGWKVPYLAMVAHRQSRHRHCGFKHVQPRASSGTEFREYRSHSRSL